MGVDVLVHVANVLYLFSYLVRDILWLRMLTVVAILCLMPYFFFQPTPLWAPIGWNVVFTAINGFQIYLLLLERRPVKLSEAEQRLYQLVFRSLTPREMLKLISLAEWKTARAGEVLCEEGVDVDSMLLLHDGRARVLAGGAEVAALGAGQFVGEMSFLTGKKTSARVVAADEVHYVAWPRDALKEFLGRNVDLNAALQMILGIDLVEKLQPANS